MFTKCELYRLEIAMLARIKELEEKHIKIRHEKLIDEHQRIIKLNRDLLNKVVELKNM